MYVYMYAYMNDWFLLYLGIYMVNIVLNIHQWVNGKIIIFQVTGWLIRNS